MRTGGDPSKVSIESYQSLGGMVWWVFEVDALFGQQYTGSRTGPAWSVGGDLGYAVVRYCTSKHGEGGAFGPRPRV